MYLKNVGGSNVVENLQERLAMKDLIGATAKGRSGLGLFAFERFADAAGNKKWAMLVKELKGTEEECRLGKATQQSQQGRWIGWESAEQRRLTWSDLWTWKPGRVSFVVRSTYDQLPTPANLCRWRMRDNSSCPMCRGSTCNLKHILAGCTANLGMYKWRNDNVLKVLNKWLRRALNVEKEESEEGS